MNPIPRARTTVLAAAALALATLAAAQSIEHQRIEYERQQREYWRAQEAQRLEDQRRQQIYDEQRKRDEASKQQMERATSPSTTSQPDSAPRGSYGSGGDAAAEVEALRKKLEKQPALAPERNPLLGQWRLVARAKAGANGGGLGELMQMITGSACEMLLGDGIWDFRPQAIHSIDKGIGETELDKAEYRGNGSTVAVLPRRFARLMVFEMQSPNRARFVHGDCVMERAGARQAGVNKAGTQPMAHAAAAPAAAARPAQQVCGLTFLDKLGVATFNPVRQALDARYLQTLHGTVPNSNLTRLDARGSACDDPRINATLYDFDANGVLRSVTYVWARPAGPAPAPIFSERVRSLSIHHPGLPPPQGPGRLQADTSLGRLILQDMPERNLLLEAYAVRR